MLQNSTSVVTELSNVAPQYWFRLNVRLVLKLTVSGFRHPDLPPSSRVTEKKDIKSHHNGWIFSVKTMENVNFIHHTDRTSPWEQFDPLKYSGYHTYQQVQHSKPSTMPTECISVLRTVRLVTTYTTHWLLPRVLYALHISPAGNVHNDTNHRPPNCGLLTSLLPLQLAPKQSPQYPAIQNSFNLSYSFHGRY